MLNSICIKPGVLPAKDDAGELKPAPVLGHAVATIQQPADDAGQGQGSTVPTDTFAPTIVAPATPGSTFVATSEPPPSAATASAAQLFQLGIPQAALLAPVPPPPRKKRKSQDEFTISQKLKILSELRAPNAPSVLDLAARHNTSRQSIYRWKKDAPRLLRLCKRQGKGHYKRVASKRKLYNEEYTAAEKLAVVRELKGENAPSVRSLGERIGANHRSIYRWKKDEKRLIKLVEQEGKGGCKRSGDDPLFRVKEALKVFHANHYACATGEQLQQPLTGTIIVAKARQIRDEMLAQHDLTPFLSNEEVKGLKEFTASTSWGRKIVHKFGWKDSSTASTYVAPANTTAKDDGNVLTLTDSLHLRNAVHYPLIHTSASAGKSQMLKVNEMKKEISWLKNRLSGAELLAQNLQRENGQLRAHLVTLMKEQNLEVKNAQMTAHIFTLTNNNINDESNDSINGEMLSEITTKDRAGEAEIDSLKVVQDTDGIVDEIATEREEGGAEVLNDLQLEV